jgi:hypothetical protein
MKVALHAAALLLARRDQSLARVLEIGSHTHSVRGHTCLTCQILQQASIGSTESLAWCARREYQLTYGRALVHERHA